MYADNPATKTDSIDEEIDKILDEIDEEGIYFI